MQYLILTETPTWTGSLPTWLLLIMAAAAAWRLSRGGGGSAVSELSKANDVLTAALERERTLRIELQKRVDLLEKSTNFALAMADHEQQARERHEATLSVLKAIETHIASSKETP